MMISKQEQYREQVLSNLINETKIIHNKEVDWYTIELPFLNTHVNGNRRDNFNNHIILNYGILSNEVDEIWGKYTQYIIGLHESVIGRKDGVWRDEYIKYI